MDVLKRVQPGSDLVITASTWNRFIDTAQRSAAEPRPSAGGRPLEGSAWRPAVTVLVNNTGGSAIAPRAILTPTGAVLDPATDPLEARRNPVVTGVAPASATDPVVIVLDGIAPGTVGRAVVAGVTVAQVSVTSTSHRFARPVVGDSSQLISAAAGPVRLFVPPVATGTQTVYVVLGAAGTSATSDGGGGGTDGNCFGDGWRIGLTAEDEWALRVLADGESIYVEDGATVTINGVEYEIDFNYAAPSLSLISPVGSAPPIVGTLDCTACPCFKFAFPRSAFGLGTTVPLRACDRILYVTVCQWEPEPVGVPCCPDVEIPSTLCFKLLQPDPFGGPNIEYTGTLEFGSYPAPLDMAWAGPEAQPPNEPNVVVIAFGCWGDGGIVIRQIDPEFGGVNLDAVSGGIASCDPLVFKQSWRRGSDGARFKFVAYDCSYTGDLSYTPLPPPYDF